MPNVTFNNLPASKKIQIEQVLLDTFYNKAVTQVKVSEIVEAMQMSRGAFYKYFIDLEDAYSYMVRQCANTIHIAIIKVVEQESGDLFAGLSQYLVNCSKLDIASNEWKQLKLLTQKADVLAKRSMQLTLHSPLLQRWDVLLKQNGFDITDKAESISLLYFLMALVVDALTDFFVNQWDTDTLLNDFNYKIKWLTKGLKSS